MGARYFPHEQLWVHGGNCRAKNNNELNAIWIVENALVIPNPAHTTTLKVVMADDSDVQSPSVFFWRGMGLPVCHSPFVQFMALHHFLAGVRSPFSVGVLDKQNCILFVVVFGSAISTVHPWLLG
jgi:hypothetical protein